MRASNHLLVIATTNGVNRYDFEKETFFPVQVNQPARIFEMTYRNEVIHGFDFCRCYADTVDKYDISTFADYTQFGGEIWLGGQSFGHELKSAFTVYGSIFGNNYFTFLANHFWATENGLFQIKWDHSYTTTSTHNHYLKGININKITSIYGLSSFSTPYDYGGARENLLVGTDSGLYFSDSHYETFSNDVIPFYTFTHYDDLGNLKVNDVCVNANTYEVISPYVGVICEDGIWVATVHGLYLLKPDYTAYQSKMTLDNSIQFEGKPSDVSELQSCGNIDIKAVINPYRYRGATVQWYKDGNEIPNESNSSLHIESSGDYSALLYDPCSNVHIQSNHLKVTQLSGPVFTFNYPDKLSYCYGSTATLQTENNPNYQYRWYTNGVLNGNTTNKLNTIQPGIYKLEVSACSGSWVPTKTVDIAFVKVPAPLIQADKTAACAGSAMVLTATVPIDASNVINWGTYQFQWFKDDVALPNSNSSTLSVTQPGNYKVKVTSCAGNTATSAAFQPNFVDIALPVVTPDKKAYCAGSQANLSVNLINDGTYIIDWIRNGTVLPEAHNKTSILTSLPGSYVAIVSSSLSSCNTPSAPYQLSFEPAPLLVLERVINTTLCDGQTVGLKATYSGGTVTWNTGSTSAQIDVKKSGVYNATVATGTGCEVTSKIDVQFFKNPTLSVPDATLCQFTNDELTLSAPSGYQKYEWNGIVGNQTYTLNKLGAVSLTVTDENGCKASQTINITSHCKDVHIPNTFTPNGDGVNDFWTIAGLDNDITVTVKIFDRAGSIIYQSTGYNTPWDGTVKGRKVPAGTYYYLITGKAASQVLSGYIAVLY